MPSSHLSNLEQEYSKTINFFQNEGILNIQGQLNKPQAPDAPALTNEQQELINKQLKHIIQQFDILNQLDILKQSISSLIEKSNEDINDINTIAPKLFFPFYKPENFPFSYHNNYSGARSKAELQEETKKLRAITNFADIVTSAYPITHHKPDGKIRRTTTFPEHKCIDDYLKETQLLTDPKHQMAAAVLKYRIILNEFSEIIALLSAELKEFLNNSATTDPQTIFEHGNKFLTTFKNLNNAAKEIEQAKQSYTEYYKPKLRVDIDKQYLDQLSQKTTEELKSIAKDKTQHSDERVYAQLAADIKQANENFPKWAEAVSNNPELEKQLLDEAKRGGLYSIAGHSATQNYTTEETMDILHTGFSDVGIDDDEFKYFILAVMLQHTGDNDAPNVTVSFSGTSFWYEIYDTRGKIQLPSNKHDYSSAPSVQILPCNPPSSNEVELLVRYSASSIEKMEEYSLTQYDAPEVEHVIRFRLIDKKPKTNPEPFREETQSTEFVESLYRAEDEAEYGDSNDSKVGIVLANHSTLATETNPVPFAATASVSDMLSDRFEVKLVDCHTDFYNQHLADVYVVNAKNLAHEKLRAKQPLLQHDQKALSKKVDFFSTVRPERPVSKSHTFTSFPTQRSTPEVKSPLAKTESASKLQMVPKATNLTIQPESASSQTTNDNVPLHVSGQSQIAQSTTSVTTTLSQESLNASPVSIDTKTSAVEATPVVDMDTMVDALLPPEPFIVENKPQQKIIDLETLNKTFLYYAQPTKLDLVKNYLSAHKKELLISFLMGMTLTGLYIGLNIATGGAFLITLPYVAPISKFIFDLVLINALNNIWTGVAATAVFSLASGVCSSLLTTAVRECSNLISNVFTSISNFFNRSSRQQQNIASSYEHTNNNSTTNMPSSSLTTAVKIIPKAVNTNPNMNIQPTSIGQQYSSIVSLPTQVIVGQYTTPSYPTNSVKEKLDTTSIQEPSTKLTFNT